MTKIKICGITNLFDALQATKCGADMLGFNFYQKSPRYIDPLAAAGIIEKVPENVKKVGVFVNTSNDVILETIKTARLDAVQLHGDESPSSISDLGRRFESDVQIIKALRVNSDFKSDDAGDLHVGAILLDGFSPLEFGGTGNTFDWTVAQQVRQLFPGQLYLAGGLTAENVADAIQAVRPYAVDACSSLESKPGCKDQQKMEEFIDAVRRTS
jgi:phosphoribosylanthranilate isomerase